MLSVLYLRKRRAPFTAPYDIVTKLNTETVLVSLPNPDKEQTPFIVNLHYEHLSR